MAREIGPERDISHTLAAAQQWINRCLIEDGSLFSSDALWTPRLLDEVYRAFVEHPDFGDESFVTKLTAQMNTATEQAKHLMAEMLWALLLFPSNMKAQTKRQQIRDMWALAGNQISEAMPLMRDEVLMGIGSGGPGFNNYRPQEMTFLLAITRDIKGKSEAERRGLFSDYDVFCDWIVSVPQKGHRQFRHMLRYFAFPDRVERMSSNNDRELILDAFDVAPRRETRNWTDQKLDDALLKLRTTLTKDKPSSVMDFYMPSYRARWAPDRKIKTPEGEVSVIIPKKDEEENGDAVETKSPEARQSIQIQAKLAEIGSIMGFKVWVPRSDRGRVSDLVDKKHMAAFLEDLPLNYDETTLDTIEQIDVLWLKGRSIARAFEVEHTTAVYSGLLRMADLLALQPNMDIRLHIVAPEERREKVFREMLRPVFSLLDRGPLSRSCTFISYDGVVAIRDLEYLAHTNDSIIKEYEEEAEV